MHTFSLKPQSLGTRVNEILHSGLISAPDPSKSIFCLCSMSAILSCYQRTLEIRKLYLRSEEPQDEIG